MITTQHRRGFMFADVVMGLAVVAILAGVLAVLANRQNQAANRLADTRSAVRLAERAMTALQTGQAIPKASETAWVKVMAVGQSAAVGDLVWVQVEAQTGRQKAMLLGLAPKQALDEERGGK